MTEVEIRGVCVEDGDNGLWEVYGGLTKAPALKKEQLSALIEELNSDVKRELVVAVNGDGIVLGTASLMMERKLIRGGALCGHIEDVVVSDKARGQGLGKRLVTHLSDIARGQGCYKVILDCAENNVAFYERCGFKRKEVQMAMYFE